MFVKSTLKMCLTEHKVLIQLHFCFLYPFDTLKLKGTLSVARKGAFFIGLE